MMHKYAAIVAYDGTDFFGWQEQQRRVRTVVGELQRSFAYVFNQDIKIVGASRTDAGVHAEHQVFRFHADLSLPDDQILEVWSRRLPLDIKLIKLGSAQDDFHPHHEVEYKIYRYVIFHTRPSVRECRYGWWYDRPLDSAKLQESLQVFVGTHDFRSFCTGDDHLSTIRTVERIESSTSGDSTTITVIGPSFLRYQIRRMVGAAAHVASKRHLSLDTLRETLAARDPRHHLVTAPPSGLTLQHIAYKIPIFK